MFWPVYYSNMTILIGRIAKMAVATRADPVFK